MRRICSTRNLADAYLVRDFLDAAGLEPELRGEHLVGSLGGLPITADTQPSIWVEDALEATARALLAERMPRSLIDDDIDADAADDDGGARDAMEALLLVVERLARNPRRGDELDEARAHAATLTRAQRPFGIAPEGWTRVTQLAAALAGAAADEDDAGVQQRSEELRSLLRDYV